MKKVWLTVEKCKACGLCIAYCPKKAISFTDIINTQGYLVTEVDDEKCIGCGVCYTVCPDGVYAVNLTEEEVEHVKKTYEG